MIYLGLGSNSGDRHKNIRRSLQLLEQQGLRISRLAPLLETPAVLPDKAPEPWNYPFLNVVAEVDTEISLEQLRDGINAIYQELGRPDNLPSAAPRSIDIDILLWHQEIINNNHFTIPHPKLHQCAYHLSSLLHLNPDNLLRL